MNPPEPLLTPAANVQTSTTGHKLPEQTRIPNVCVPRPVSMSMLLNQWQSMGIRISVDLPFTGNDQDFIFVCRNGPLIPYWSLDYAEKSPDVGHWPNNTNPYPGPFRQYAWNNMRNVFHGYEKPGPFPAKAGVFITQYDLPPILSTMAQTFRRWRGAIQYRIRTVAGFATQGYVFVGPLKNYYQQIGVYDEYNYHLGIQRSDSSYREVQQNSYIPADTSMFRHIELTMPYEYPTPWYDQFAWMSRRVTPARYVRSGDISFDTFAAPLTNEPHGDNYFAMGIRGNLAATQEGAQIEFELEYRAVEGFQFADPYLPPAYFASTHRDLLINDFDKIKRVPDPTLTSDGLSKITKTGSRTVRSVSSQSIAQRRKADLKLDLSGIDLGEDTVDPVMPSGYGSREREFTF
ncbi:putative capsid protein [Linepithema humile polycipivirus 1]|nr:putative capsid protein [Linepithema humile polycipivirus 1]